MRHEGWGTTGDRLSLAFLAPNLRTNGWFYFADARFPVVYSVLALMRIDSVATAHAVFWSFSIYFLLFWGIFLFFYAGSYNYGADDRFSLMTYPPLAILAGIGLSKLSGAIDSKSRGPQASRIVASVLAVQFLWYMPVVRAVGEEAWAARADVDVRQERCRRSARQFHRADAQPEHVPPVGAKRRPGLIGVDKPGYAENILGPRYAGGVFFHWNFWCNVADPVQQSFCTDVLSRFPHTLVRESRERDYRFAIYRLDVSSERNGLPPQ